MVASTTSSPQLLDSEIKVEKTVDLNFFDLTGKKSSTKGTSNKCYHAELQSSTKSELAQIYTMWGATGGHQTKDWRHYTDLAKAQKDFDLIIKAKIKKGYVEVQLMDLSLVKDEADKVIKTSSSMLHRETQRLISMLFESTNDFVKETLKCPLGQLSQEQITQGQLRLDQVKDILNSKSKVKLRDEKIVELTNEFYALIPHNLGVGFRGTLSNLLLDDLNKIVQKEQDLAILSDAKGLSSSLDGHSGVDKQYSELNADIEWIDHSDPLFLFMRDYFNNTKVHQHGYSGTRVKNIWKMNRKDKESELFLLNSESIAKECGNHVFVENAQPTAGSVRDFIPSKRPDLSSKEVELFEKANTWLVWHGTRNANVIGITKKGLMIRPSGAVHTGSLFGDGKYMAYVSSKSLNYCSNGYYTGRSSNNSSRFMFLLDASFGNMHIGKYGTFYKGPPKGFHSVYGKANVSGVINDEMITYDFKQKDTQSRIRYLLEIDA